MLPVIASIIEALMASSAQGNATNLGYQNLAFQKENARDQRRLATATRPDVYGNETSFDEVLNKWNINLTPTQKSIVDSMQREQSLSLTEDAGRARDLRRRQEKRSIGAEGDYERLVNEYRYNQPESEGAQEEEAIGDIARARAGREGAGLDALSRTALRSGGGGTTDYARLLQAAEEAAGGGAGEDILKGKALGRERAGIDRAAHENRYLPALRQFQTTADTIGSAPPRFSDIAGEKDQTIQQMLAAMGGAMANEGNQVGGAMSDLSRLVSASPDLSGIIKSLTEMGKSGTPKSFSANIVDPYGTAGVGGRVGPANYEPFRYPHQ